jgi:hypothetical protein
VGSRGGRQVPTRPGQVAAMRPESRRSVRRGPAQLSGGSHGAASSGARRLGTGSTMARGRSSPREEEER